MPRPLRYHCGRRIPRGQVLPLKRFVDDALAHCTSIKPAWWCAGATKLCHRGKAHHGGHRLLEEVSARCEAEQMDAGLLLTFTPRGTTGKPKARHTTGGYPHQLPAPLATSSTCGKRMSLVPPRI